MRIFATVRRFPLLYWLVVLIGCHKPVPRLQYVAIGIAENQQPVVFGVKVENTGNNTVTVDSCDTNVMFNYLLAGPGNPEDLPAAFNYSVALVGTEEALEVDPGETATIPFTFIWDTPTDAPPMVG